MKRLSLYAASWTLCAVLAGCASLGLVQPQSFEERLGAAYTTNTAIREAAANSLASAALSSEEGEYALAQTREARKLLDATRLVARGGDITSAEGRLELVTKGLTLLRTYLEGKGVKVEEKP